MSKLIFWIGKRKFIMSKAKAKLEARIVDKINAVAEKEGWKMETISEPDYATGTVAKTTKYFTPNPPPLRWLCVKEPKLFRSGEFILQYKAHDGNWYEVPEVSMVH